jgi:Protein tyrosine phosphatase-like protein, PTPLA
MLTITAWSFGDTIRFACFCLDSLVPGGLHLAKAIRYTVAPLLFPVGFGGEFLMILAAAKNGRPLLFAVAALWPFGFYVLMSQRTSSKDESSLQHRQPTTLLKPITPQHPKIQLPRSKLSSLYTIAATFSL